VGKLPELVDRHLRCLLRRRQERGQLRSSGGFGPRSSQSKVVGDGKHTLLGPVVEVPLQTAALRVAGLDHPSP
jgi:hypothetical protein